MHDDKHIIFALSHRANLFYMRILWILLIYLDWCILKADGPPFITTNYATVLANNFCCQHKFVCFYQNCIFLLLCVRNEKPVCISTFMNHPEWWIFLFSWCASPFIYFKKIGTSSFKQIARSETNWIRFPTHEQWKNREIYLDYSSWLQPLQNVEGVNRCWLHISPEALNTQLHAMFTSHYFQNINIYGVHVGESDSEVEMRRWNC